MNKEAAATYAPIETAAAAEQATHPATTVPTIEYTKEGLPEGEYTGAYNYNRVHKGWLQRGGDTRKREIIQSGLCTPRGAKS